MSTMWLQGLYRRASTETHTSEAWAQLQVLWTYFWNKWRTWEAHMQNQHYQRWIQAILSKKLDFDSWVYQNIQQTPKKRGCHTPYWEMLDSCGSLQRVARLAHSWRSMHDEHGIFHAERHQFIQNGVLQWPALFKEFWNWKLFTDSHAKYAYLATFLYLHYSNGVIWLH